MVSADELPEASFNLDSCTQSYIDRDLCHHNRPTFATINRELDCKRPDFDTHKHTHNLLEANCVAVERCLSRRARHSILTIDAMRSKRQLFVHRYVHDLLADAPVLKINACGLRADFYRLLIGASNMIIATVKSKF